MSTAFRVILEGTQEVPPNGSMASGVGTVVFDSAAVAASYSFDTEGLDFGPATGGSAQTPTTLDDVAGSHFHNQTRGVNGPVVFGQIQPEQDNDDLAIELNGDGSWSVSGRWESTDPANVSIANFAATLGSAAVGSDVPLYYNLHTTQFPGGAIRGQLVAVADDIDDVETGTAGNDVIDGGLGNDAILGLAGDDTLNGDNGNDVLDGGGGNDRLTGGNGNDVLYGSVGIDGLVGGNGEDYLDGGAGNDDLDGGNGKDTVNGGTGDDVLDGSNGKDTLNGDGGDDLLLGGNGGDTLFGGDGNDTLFGDGGDDNDHGEGDDDEGGADTALFSGSQEQYSVARSGSVIVVTDNVSNRDGVDTLTGVERLRFSDKLVAVDIDGAAGQAYCLYQAAFDRTPDTPGLSYWVSNLDHGMTLSAAAASFIVSNEFKAAFGDPAAMSSSKFLDTLYQNILGRTPDPAGKAYWQEQLDHGFARETVLASFSESTENKAIVGTAIANGIVLDPMWMT